MDKLKKYLDDNMLVLVISGIGAIVLSVVVLWEAINRRFINSHLLPLSESDPANSLLFSYIDKNTLGVISTFIFWGVVATVGMFVLAVASSSYMKIRDVLTVASSYENRSQHYLIDVSKVVGLHIGQALLAIATVLFLLKVVAYQALTQFGENALALNITATSIIMSIVWLTVLWLTLCVVIFATKLAYRTLKSVDS